MAKAKYKVGEKLRCIVPIDNRKGGGWEQGLEFTVNEVWEGTSWIYFGAKDGNGVFEDALEPVNKKIEEPLVVSRLGLLRQVNALLKKLGGTDG